MIWSKKTLTDLALNHLKGIWGLIHERVHEEGGVFGPSAPLLVCKRGFVLGEFELAFDDLGTKERAIRIRPRI